MTDYSAPLQKWMDHIAGDGPALADLVADDCVFISPIVHTPQQGKALTLAYLGAAGKTLGGGKFRYVDIFDCPGKAVLEFESEIDGVLINGIDIIHWNDAGLITRFKVMVRPLKAVNAIHAAMKAQLERMAAGG
ncbi:MAG: nuclear transport factor 2 family protein [Hyphomonadaceae bacterium]